MLSSEQRELRALAREFAAGELRPHAGRRDGEGRLEDAVFSHLAELGFLGMRVPEDHGGLGFDVLTWVVVLEELAWGDPSVGLAVAVHDGQVAELLARHGSSGQKDAWLPRLASGDALGAFARTDGEAPTTARREGEGWVLEGRKPWVTNGARAGLVIVCAVEGPETGCFLVEPSASGYEVGRRAATMGFRASETVAVELEDVRVAGGEVLALPGRGGPAVAVAADLGRLGLAAVAVGIARAALEHATAYALEREQFGRPIADFGAIAGKLADMAASTAAARALVQRVAAGVDAGEDPDGASDATFPAGAAALARITASEAATRVADEAVQIFGGYGYMREYPVEKLLRDAKGTEIIEGTNEELRRIVARGLTGRHPR